MKTDIKLRVSGKMACFTIPCHKAERLSYEVITPSAARGIMESIYWKPQIKWVIHRIDIINPIRWGNIKTNEVKDKISVTNVIRSMNGEDARIGIDIRDSRTQRNMRFLRDVDYVIHAWIDPLDGKFNKHYEIFKRRASKGQSHHPPYLGMREMMAKFQFIEDDGPHPMPIDKDLGWMLYDIDYADGEPMYFRAYIDNGSIMVPNPESKEVIK